ncbi:MAG: dienelactone hydrolase family protein [Deltaproteobacteria bacterium]|nr:dienelactone hydrolase family protein [Deltaproteobacteria bacterium]
MPLLPAVEQETGPDPDASIIWLHGLGADGNDFAPIVPELKLPKSLAIRFIFPHAPSIPVTVNGGFVMPAWYDILEMEIDRKVDMVQLMKSAAEIDSFIDRELERNISGKRIIIAGFSQGGAVAYQVALSRKVQLGGLLAMSTYFATADSIELSEENKTLPIKIQHGIHDPVVPESLGQKATTRLVKLGYSVNYQSYPMEHAVCPQQIADISRWIKDILG